MQLDPKLIPILQSAQIAGNALKLPQLDRQDYVAVNKALELLGGKWNRAAQAHVFPTNPSTLIAAAIQEGAVADPQKEYQFYATPRVLARKLVTLANLQPTDRILEPSAGQGAIVDCILDDQGGRVLDRLVMVEWMPANAQALRARGWHPIEADFLTLTPALLGGGFDKIIANPPFTQGQDVTHVRHMYSLLNPGGVIVAITSPSWQFNGQRKFREFREWIEAEGFYTEEIPSGAFSESGTEVRTTLLILNKPQHET